MERAGWLCRKEGGGEREREGEREGGREGVRLTLGCHMWPKILVEIASRCARPFTRRRAGPRAMQPFCACCAWSQSGVSCCVKERQSVSVTV